MNFNGLPPMDSPSVAILGEVDVNRNGAPPGGIAADLREPASRAEKAAAPGMALMNNPWVSIGLLVGAFVWINAKTRS